MCLSVPCMLQPALQLQGASACSSSCKAGVVQYISFHLPPFLAALTIAESASRSTVYLSHCTVNALYKILLCFSSMSYLHVQEIQRHRP